MGQARGLRVSGLLVRSFSGPLTGWTPPAACLALCLALSWTAGCGSPPESAASKEALVTVHYLGHASFALTFGAGLTVLTDYGEDRAYGLDSPVFPLGDFHPKIVTLSHDHPDHAGGTLPAASFVILEGDQRYEDQGLIITPIPTFERGLESPDNFSFLFDFQGLKILHLGDCQALMGVPDAEALIRGLYPDRYDLVLLPIGFVSDILGKALDFMAKLDAGAVVPMHYWSPNDREAFLALAEGRTDSRGRPYLIRKDAGPALTVFPGWSAPSSVQLIGLDPAPPGR